MVLCDPLLVPRSFFSLSFPFPRPQADLSKEPEFYNIWKETAEDKRRRAPPHIAAPKLVLPGHAESYNPPVEYVPTPDEVKEWEVRYPRHHFWDLFWENFACCS